jgi:hypothetical protein
MPIGLSNSVLNQKNAPAIYEDIFANRPAAGFNGRIFISTDTSQIFIDNGSSWVLIANTGIGSTGNLQVVTTNGNTTNAGISITAGGFATNAAQITGLTQAGGVLFTDGSGNLAQDVNFNWDATNNYLGIGQTGIPTAPLDIHNGTLGVFMQLNATSTNNSTIAFQNASVGKWRIGNLYSSGSNLFHIYNNTAANNALTINASNAATFADSVTATAHITSGGTSGQFVKGNGTLDSTAYISLTSLSATTPLSYNNSTGAFTILQSGAAQSGYLSSTDWNTFNNKASLTAFSATTPLSYNSGTGAFSIQVANTGQSGYLTNTDWNTFNGKQSALSFGNLTETSSSILTIAGGTGAVIGLGTTIAVKQANSTQSGYLSSTDWNTFNNKQSALTNPITGTGTSGYVPKFNGTTSLTNSIIQDNGNTVTITSSSGDTIILQKGSGPSIQFNKTTATAQQWAIAGEGTAFKLYDYTSGTVPFQIAASTGAATFSSNVTAAGLNSIIAKLGSGVESTNLIAIRAIGTGAINDALNFRFLNTDGVHIANIAGILGGDNTAYGTLAFSVRNYNTDAMTEAIRINNRGNVGIGTTNPSQLLSLYATVEPAIAFTNSGADRAYISANGSYTKYNSLTGNGHDFLISGSSVVRITPVTGRTLISTTTDNGQGTLQNPASAFLGGIQVGGLTFSTNTTATVNTSFYFFNGGAGISLTLPDTNGQSMIYYIKNYSASPLTIARTGSNTFIAAGTITTVTSLTLATGVSTTIIGNGTSNYIQIQ